jgi:hypothetical protein
MTSTSLENASGHITNSVHEVWSYQWHQSLWETEPFTGTEKKGSIGLKAEHGSNDNEVANMTRGNSEYALSKSHGTS